MGNLKTSVVNRTEVVLTIADFYKEYKSDDEMYGRERYALPAGGTKTINSGKFAVAYNKRLKALDYNSRCDQQIHVCSCQHVLLVLTDEDFQKNKERELVLDMLDHRLRYAFVCPSTSVDHHWIWGEPSVCSLAELKLQHSIWSKQGLEIGRMDDLKTTVVNKTKLQLVLGDGKEEMRVGACGRTTVPSGKLCKKKTQQKIYVHSGVRDLFVLEQSVFQKNKGKELILETVEDRFRYAFVYPTVTPDDHDHHWIWSKDRSECSIAELMVEQRIWSDKGLNRYSGGVKNLETTIVNNTELLLTFMDFNRYPKKMSFVGEGFGVGAGERKTIRSGKFLEEKWGDYWAEIQVWSGQHLVLRLYPKHFLNNKGKQLILEVSQQRLRYAFAYPTFLPRRWTQSSQMELSVNKLSQLMQEEQRLARDEECKSFKTRVVNKTDFQLTLVDAELGGGTGTGNPIRCYYGRKRINVSEGGAKTICSGDFFKKTKRGYPHLKEIRVLRAQQLMLTLNSDHFHNNKGKLLILDMPHGRLTHAFLQPPSAT